MSFARLVCSLLAWAGLGLAGQRVIAGPQMAVDEAQWDFGHIFQQQVVQHNFRITNTGDAPLVISAIKSSCPACVGAMATGRVIPPGESGNLLTTFRALDRQGRQSRTLTIVSNDPNQPRFTLYVSGVIETGLDRPILSVSPETWDAGVLKPGETSLLELVVRNEGRKELRLLEIAGSENCSAQAPSSTTLEPSGKAIIRVSLHPKAQGIIQENVLLRTNDPIRPTVTVPVVGYIQANAAPDIAINTVTLSLAGKPIAIPGTGRSLVSSIRINNGLPLPVQAIKIGSAESCVDAKQTQVQVLSKNECFLELIPKLGQLGQTDTLDILLRIPVLLPTRCLPTPPGASETAR